MLEIIDFDPFDYSFETPFPEATDEFINNLEPLKTYADLVRTAKMLEGATIQKAQINTIELPVFYLCLASRERAVLLIEGDEEPPAGFLKYYFGTIENPKK